MSLKNIITDHSESEYHRLPFLGHRELLGWGLRGLREVWGPGRFEFRVGGLGREVEI